MNPLHRLVALMCFSVLAACGGGGGDSGTSPFPDSGSGTGTGSGGGGTTTASPTLSLAISSPTVTAGTPATLSAVVRDATGAGVTGQVVTFTTTAGLGVFNAGSALTDATGTAVVVLSPASSSSSGADTVVASANVAGTSVQNSVGFQLTATSVSVASFSADVASLGAYGQTNLTVSLAGVSGSTSATVALTSVCVAKGKATLTPASVTTTTGTAVFTLRDQGCGATESSDTLQAAVTGTAATASLSLGIASPAVSSITFVSASTPTIFLRGSGLNETSEVTFQIRDTAGNGLPNQDVLLEPSTLTGGLTLDGGSSSVTKRSDSLGNVTVRINSGTVPTPVRVKASLVDNASVQTVSSSLSIAVGLPAQLNFSMSQATKNIEGYDIDGTPNTYKIIASDRLGNPVPDSTAINFIAEGGQIEAAKFTQSTSGIAQAAANFVSSEPRPLDGRVTVVAYALGEESFLDTNGNNVYDPGEDFQDLGNLFLDRLYDGFFDRATDQFVSLSISGGSSCTIAGSPLLALDKSIPSISQGQSSDALGTCDGVWGRAYVRRAVETVLSTSQARPVWNSTPFNLYDGSSGACAAPVVDLIVGYASDGSGAVTGPFRSVGGGVLYRRPASGVLSFIVADANPVRLNPMAAGTTISVSGSTGLTVALLGGSPVPNTTEATFTSVTYALAAGVTSGIVTTTFTSPGGLSTTVSQSISTQDPPAGAVPCP